MKGSWTVFVGLSILAVSVLGAIPCDKRDFGESSFVCACNGDYCDEADPIGFPSFGQAILTTSDKADKRFEDTTLTFNSGSGGGDRVTWTVDKTKTRQQIHGFGGAFTDSAGKNINLMSTAAQENIMKSYFDPSGGLAYNMGRVNIGGCDFSERKYTYVDTEGDIELDTFELQIEDLDYKIPLIKQAEQIRGSPLNLMGSPWTAPPWMKSNNDYSGQGFLLPEYYQSWANYFVRFLEEYKALGVDFWGLTAQNEPMDGNIPGFSFNCMGWNATTQRDFVADFLGPALEASGYQDLELMIFDDQRPYLSLWATEVFESQAAYDYTSGMAVHWYMDHIIDIENALELTHNKFPDKFIIYTEACTGYIHPSGSGVLDDQEVMLGSWERGERYLFNIIEDLNHWVTGWIDWNLALDMQGGPNWAENYVDAPIIVNPALDEFYKQPMFYALGHVSRFFQERSIKISVEEDAESGLQFVGVQRPDFGVAIVIMNKDEVNTVSLSLVDADRGTLELEILPSSMNTLLYY